MDSFFSYKLAPGNFKDILDGGSSISKLMTFENSAGDIVLNIGLNKLDDHIGLSMSLKQELRDAFKEYQRITEWNLRYSKPLFNYSFGNGS